ncbi:hypothetical protein NUSPORA_01845 [Nucleospora cyclopteri]
MKLFLNRLLLQNCISFLKLTSNIFKHFSFQNNRMLQLILNIYNIYAKYTENIKGEVLIVGKEAENYVLVRKGNNPLLANKKYLLGENTYNVLPTQLLSVYSIEFGSKPETQNVFFNIAGQHLCALKGPTLITCDSKNNAKWVAVKTNDGVYFTFKSRSIGYCLTVGKYNLDTDTYDMGMSPCTNKNNQKFKLYKVTSKGEEGIEFISKDNTKISK